MQTHFWFKNSFLWLWKPCTPTCEVWECFRQWGALQAGSKLEVTCYSQHRISECFVKTARPRCPVQVVATAKHSQHAERVSKLFQWHTTLCTIRLLSSSCNEHIWAGKWLKLTLRRVVTVSSFYLFSWAHTAVKIDFPLIFFTAYFSSDINPCHDPANFEHLQYNSLKHCVLNN